MDWFLNGFAEAPSLISVVIIVCCILMNDVAWTMYTRRVASGIAWRAGFWASLIYLSGIIAVVNALHNYWLIVIAVITTFFGTALAVWFDARKTK